MKAIKQVDIKVPVIVTKILDDGRLLLVDSSTTIRFLNKDSFKVESGFKAKIYHERYSTDVVAFSSDGKTFATLSSDCRESRFYDASRKKLIAKLDRHQGEVSCVGIDVSNRYMFSCGDDGKTFAIDAKTGKLAFTLPIHIDTVNDIAFSKSGNWIATVSYDKKVSIFNLSTMTPKVKLMGHSSPAMKVSFIGENKLISVDKDNKAIIWSVYSEKIITRLDGIHDDVTQILVCSNKKFLFIGTKLGHIIIYDLKTYEQLSRSYIKLNSSISSMAFDEEKQHLIISTAKGGVFKYDIYEGLDSFKELLKNKNFLAIQNSTIENPILKYTEIYDLVINMWDKTFEKAKIYLFKQDKKTAISLFSHFRKIPSKNTIIQKTLKEFENYDKFLTFAKNGKIVLAYGLANSHPIYKESKVYKSLEARWKKAFLQAQKYMLNPKGGEKAKTILAPYRGISDKTRIMHDLFTKVEVYKRFRDSIGQKNFKLASDIIKQYQFLKDFPEYNILMNYADNLYIKVNGFIEANEIPSAIKILRILSDFTDFAEEAKEMIRMIDVKQRFLVAVRDENIALSYNLLARNPELQEIIEGIELQKIWNRDLAEANLIVHNGDISEIKIVMKKYMKISSKYVSLGIIFSWAYMVQLEKAIKSDVDRYVIEKGIKNYILYFGLDDQILSLFETFKDKFDESKLSLELLTKGSLDMWRPAMIVDSILE